MIFTPDPLKRAKRELQAALNQAIDAEVQKQHAFSMAEYVNAKVAFLQTYIKSLEKQNAQNPTD